MRDPRPGRIVYCHCAYAKVVPEDVKQDVLRELSASGASFDAVADLCEMSARRDPDLHDVASEGSRIVACYPRAVQWLFSAAGTPLPEGVSVLNMRTAPARDILDALDLPQPEDRP